MMKPRDSWNRLRWRTTIFTTLKQGSSAYLIHTAQECGLTMGVLCLHLLARPCGENHLTVFGDGSQTRSFCYVDDLVEGICRLLMSDYALPVNIGNPNEITLKAFAEEVRELTGASTNIEYKPLPVDDPKAA
jgi:nucleoside-diphosphate-sugar epimerase